MGPGSSGQHPVPGSWFLTPSSTKGRRTLEKQRNLRLGAGETHDEPGTSCGDEGTNVFRKQSRHGSQSERAAEVGQLSNRNSRKAHGIGVLVKIMNALNSTQTQTNDWIKSKWEKRC